MRYLKPKKKNTIQCRNWVLLFCFFALLFQRCKDKWGGKSWVIRRYYLYDSENELRGKRLGKERKVTRLWSKMEIWVLLFVSVSRVRSFGSYGLVEWMNESNCWTFNPFIFLFFFIFFLLWLVNTLIYYNFI